MREPPKPQIFCLGANHKSASVQVREELFLPQQTLERTLPKLQDLYQFQEIAAISTCNRVELFGVIDRSLAREAVLHEAFITLQNMEEEKPLLSASEIQSHTFLHFDEKAVRHVFNIPASLDSLILGETQITGQFKDAIALARHCESLGPLLNRLSQEALSAAKKVRNQTAIGKRPVSISHAAIDLAQRVFGEVKDHVVLIVGAGEMAQIAAKYLISYKPKELFLANRTPERCEAMAKDLGMGKCFGLDEIPNLLVEADIILSSTGSQKPIITEEILLEVHKRRRGRPQFFLDIAIPRDIEPRCSEIDDVYLFDIDDLQQVVGEHYDERRKAAESAKPIIDEAVISFQRWLDGLSLKPALSGFHRYLRTLADQEMEKTMARQSFKDLSDEQRQSINRMVESIIGKINADAGQTVRNPPEGHYNDRLADALKVLFPPPEEK